MTMTDQATYLRFKQSLQCETLMILHHTYIAGVVSTYAGVCGKAGDVDGNAAEALFSDVWDVQCLDNCSVLVAEPGSGRIRTIQDSSGTCPDPAASTAGLVPQHFCICMQPHIADIVANLTPPGCDQLSLAVTRVLSIGDDFL